MKKYLTGLFAGLAFTVLAIGSIFWHLGVMNERAIQELTDECLRRGYDVSWSMEPGFLKSSFKLSCIPNSGIGSKPAAADF